MSQPFRSYALISLQQIARNFRGVCGLVGPGVEVTCVVKADAYGHGAVEVSRALIGEGARWLAVSSVEEGVRLRAGGIRGARILIMGGALPYELDLVAEYGLTPAVHSLNQIHETGAAARRLGAPLRYHLKIDSGMGRLGTRAHTEAIVAAAGTASGATLEGLMTHLASAADYSSPQTEEQLAYFHGILESLRRAGIHPEYVHASSTNAVSYGRCAGRHNMVRAGIALYGYVSPARGDAPSRQLDVKPALAWKAKLLAVKDIPEGAPVGYGATFRAPKAMRIGVLGAGYADGVFHRLSNRGKVIAGGKFAAILGTVSMDLTTIDLTAAPHLVPGDEVTLLGSEGDAHLDAQQIARTAGTISYDILCGISARVHRVYV